VLGSIRTVEAPHPPGLRLRYASLIDGMREAIDKRIRAVLPGDRERSPRRSSRASGTRSRRR
jgi:hypothetical protein